VNEEDFQEDFWADIFPSVCPGCDGQWGASEQGTAADAVCVRCGLSRREALALLWDEITTAYAAAYTSAKSGDVAEARRLLRPFLSSPFAGDLLPRLDALCALVLGEISERKPILGDEGKEILAHADYNAAHAAARLGDFPAALLLIDRCLTVTPSLLPAQKLRILLLAGTGRAVEAETLRVEMARFFSAEPDIIAWRFAESPRIEQLSVVVASPEINTADTTERNAVSVSRRRLRRSAERSLTRRMPHRQTPGGKFAFPIALGALFLAAVSLTISLSRFQNSPETATVPVTSPSASPSIALPSVLEKGTRSPGVASENSNSVELTTDLDREWRARRQDADFAQARYWFNRAVRAKAQGDWQECDRLAAAAALLGKNSYLHDESLVLRALAADNRGSSIAERIARYNAIVEKTPNSAYAPWARRMAAQLAARLAISQGQPNPRSRAERRAANHPETGSEQGIR
jgi:tetratricopeptide (TPR) repeat protein